MMAYVFKDDYEMTMLQVNQTVLTRLMEGAQHEDVDDDCDHSPHSDGDQSDDQRTGGVVMDLLGGGVGGVAPGHPQDCTR